MRNTGTKGKKTTGRSGRVVEGGQPRVFAVDHWLEPLGRGWCLSATVSVERGRASEECEKETAKENKWTLGVLPASVCLPAWFPLQTKVMPFPAEVGVRAFWIPVTSHTFFNLTAQGILLWSFCEGLDRNWGKSKQRGGNGSKKSELEDKKRGGKRKDKQVNGLNKNDA